MSKEKQKSFSGMSDFEQFQELPCITFKQAQTSNASQQKLPIHSNPPSDSQSSDYIQYVRQKVKEQVRHYLLLLIIKTIVFGIMIGIFILIVCYDKLFFSTHYYMQTPEYKQGQLGIDVKKAELKNMPNHELGSGQEFNIQKMNGNGNWNPQPRDPDAYHQINPQTKKDKYDLEGYIMKEIILKNFPDNYNMDEYSLAVHLLQVTHNVDYKGQINIQKTKHQNQELDMEQKRKRIQKILKIQKDRYQKKYQLSKYIQNQLPFCLIVSSYNNVESRLYLRNLDSIFMQEYQNYHVVYIDDASPDKTGQFVNKYIEEKNIPKEKIKVIINKKNVLALANLYKGVLQHCNSGEIVMLLDGDDAFLGRQVMGLFNAVYQKNRAAVVYSRYFVVENNDRGGIGGSSREIPHEFLQNGKFRSMKGFFTSHLLTFYADLFWRVKQQDLKYSNGTFFKFAYDVALITPIIEMVGTKIHFIQQTTYEYRFDTGINDPGWGQIQVDDIVFSKPKYPRLTEFPFIDKFYNEIQNRQKASKS